MKNFLKWLKRKDKIITLIIEIIVSVLIWILIGLLGQCGFNINIFIFSCFLTLFVCYFTTVMSYFDSNATEKRIEKLERSVEMLEKQDNMYQRKKCGENMRMDNAKFIIKFMPDYGSTSLWPVNEEARKTFGTPIQYDELSISDTLRMDLERLDEKIMSIIDWNNPGGQSKISIEERQNIFFEANKILYDLVEELGADYQVIDDIDWIRGD